jgi:ribosomal subunit interface protein
VEIIVRGRHITVPSRFRQHATAKLAKLSKLDQKVVRIDVEVSNERNPRQSDRRERVELTIRSRGPAIRAEAAAEDRYAALDLAFAKLEARLRRASDRRKVRHGDPVSVRSPGTLAGVDPSTAPDPSAAPDLSTAPDPSAASGLSTSAVAAAAGVPSVRSAASVARHPSANGNGAAAPGDQAMTESDAGLVPIQMEGDGPLLVREKVHAAMPMTIDQALLAMELVGHDFYLFHDSDCDRFSVVYRRRGYDYGVIRLVEE